MSKPPLPPEAVELLAKANPCVMATVRSDGAPVTTATWYLWEDDGRVLLNLDDGRARLRHVENDPRVSVTVLDENWYTHVTLIGRVTDTRADEGLVDIDRLARHYTGGPYPDRVRPRTSVRMTVDRWHGWGAMKDNDQAG